MTAQEALRLALGRHQAGQLEEAAGIYQQIIAAAPTMADAWHLLGVTHLQRGDHAAALKHIDEAIRLAPRMADFYANRAEALRGATRYAEASAAARKALQLNPQQHAASNTLGLAQLDSGDTDAAIRTLQKLLTAQPGHVQGWNNLGSACKAAQRLPEARDAYQRALALQPQQAILHYNLAEVLLLEGSHTQALAAFDTALALAPQLLAAQKGRAYALLQCGHIAEAEAQFTALLAAAPGEADAWNNYGLLLAQVERMAEATQAYQRALAIDSDHRHALNNIAIALRSQLQLAAAETALRHLQTLQPEHAQSWVNLALVLKAQGRIDEALAATRRGLALAPHAAQAASNLLFDLHYVWPALSAAEMGAAHQDWAQQFAPTLPPRPPLRSRAPGAPLRIGYVSPDLRLHPVGFLLAGLLPRHDRQHLHVTCYADVAAPDSQTAQLRASVDSWCDIAALSDAAVCEKVRADGIDVLIDLAGHSAKQRLGVFAQRPAPVAISWLGYFDTSGLNAIDFIITDPHSTPAHSPQVFAEAPLFLPDCRFCYSPPDYAPLPAPAPCLRNGHITFGSFNNYAKLNDGVLDLWAALLLAIPSARLLLKTGELGDAATHDACLARFAARGIDTARLTLGGYSPHADMLAEYAKMDIALDPFPFTGGMSTLEALWMGVPVLTLAGESMVARQGVAILHSAGLSDWISEDAAHYLALAKRWAAEPKALAELRAGMRARLGASPLCDAGTFTRHLDALLLDAYTRIAGNSPRIAGND